ncbi:hypothetical protein KL920_002110 [Ogataea angusta]|nr:hypothetical protein KL920_002110 [Ogataea angusta]
MDNGHADFGAGKPRHRLRRRRPAAVAAEVRDVFRQAEPANRAQRPRADFSGHHLAVEHAGRGDLWRGAPVAGGNRPRAKNATPDSFPPRAAVQRPVRAAVREIQREQEIPRRKGPPVPDGDRPVVVAGDLGEDPARLYFQRRRPRLLRGGAQVHDGRGRGGDGEVVFARDGHQIPRRGAAERRRGRRRRRRGVLAVLPRTAVPGHCRVRGGGRRERALAAVELCGQTQRREAGLSPAAALHRGRIRCGDVHVLDN